MKSSPIKGPSSPAIRVLTPHGTGAIAVIAVCVPGGADILETTSPTRGTNVTLRSVQGDDGIIDEVLIVPRGRDRFEIHCHGGVMVVEKLVRRLAKRLGDEAVGEAALELWCRPAERLPAVETLWGLRMLAAARRHGLSRWAQEQMAGSPAADGVTIKRMAQWISTASADLPRFLNVTVRIALIGPPNAGKSSVANFWLGHPMSVTSDVPGTTRDWVEQTVIVAADDIEIAARLTDTAGVRRTDDELERLSIDRGMAAIADADMVLVVMDVTRVPSPEALVDEAWRWAREHGVEKQLDTVPWMVVGNKCDLLPFRPAAANWQRRSVWVSAITGTGMADLQHHVLELLGVPRQLHTPVISESQFTLLASLIHTRTQTELAAALERIAALDGEIF